MRRLDTDALELDTRRGVKESVADRTLVRRRLDRIWAALGEKALGAIVLHGRGVVGGHGFIAYASGYTPVVRAASVVLFPGAEPAIVVSTAADAWYARHRAGITDVRVAGQGDILSEYDDLASGVVHGRGDGV